MCVCVGVLCVYSGEYGVLCVGCVHTDVCRRLGFCIQGDFALG